MNDSKKTKNKRAAGISNLEALLVQLEELQSKYAQVEEDKNELQSFWEGIFNTTVDGIIVTDENGSITMINQAAENMLGYSHNELLGMNTLVLRPAGDEYEKKGAEFIAKLLEQGIIMGWERAFVRKDGSLIDVEVNTAFLKDSKGNFTGAVGSLRDISERKLAEKRLNEYQQQLRSLASQLTLAEQQERRTFATYLHDHIGQTLFVLKIKIEMLSKSLDATHCSGTVKEINAIIENLIRDTRSLTFELSPPILYQLGLSAALEWLFEQMHQQYGLSITFEDDQSLQHLDDDIRVLLFRGVRELLINVAKHAHAEKVNVSARRNNNKIYVCVKDDGIGMQIPITSLNTHEGEGRGFGLFSIKERLEHLGGQLTIDSQPACGSAVTLIAPLKDKG
jgi:PAS domain S-box-containing protein